MTEITPRSAFGGRSAIRHRMRPLERCYTVPMQRKLEAYYGTTALDDVLAIISPGTGLVCPLKRSVRSLSDEFGVVWNRTVDQDIGVVEEFQLTSRSLSGYRFPDPRNALATRRCRCSSRPTRTASGARPSGSRCSSGVDPARHGGPDGGYARSP